MYLHVRMTWQWVRLLRHVIQIGCLMFAMVVSVSRMWDNKHHWSDVVAGAALGATVAAVMVGS
jgi:phosphatidate phosphatase